ncbi:TonB-dependent receptor family protein [Pseudotenacibaculum haliotis]|uniref:TonB-dependent receptor family protein n=1 Tax=Pseudotenacibaculum haliotis TaxID=1862138 RepID=A0ABW5LTY4_9FLAO
MRRGLTLLALMITMTLFSQNNEKKEDTSLDSLQKLDEVILKTNVIFGNKYVAQNRTGSAYYISPKELKKFNFTDINRALRSVPGVNIYEEDGFGLRPNISLRGTSPERSAKITLMEDGILIAPAPYSASSAYYFPTIARMQAVEVLKGSSQVQYGPFTTGGAINMISNQIPESFSGNVRASYGSFNSSQLHAILGDSKNNFGYSIEFLNYGSDGFKDLFNGKDTGFDKNDFVAKFRVNLFPSARVKQSLEAKFQYSDEESNETYLGLTDQDFDANPFSRYAGSANDLMKNIHRQIVLTHQLDFSKDFRITTNLYNNYFTRNWYKADYITFNGTRESIGTVFGNPTTYADYISLVKGDINSDGDDTINLRANNRTYKSRGIQTKFDYHWYQGDVFHDIEVGLRYHYDEEDRFQWIDDYAINNGELTLANAGTPGSNANRISSARAFAAFATYKVKVNNWTFTPGIRYENINLERENFGGSDPNRTGANLSTRENSVDVFIPGIGTNYKFNNNVSVFGGVHKGFSPPGNQPDEKPEESINYELGTRFNLAGIRGEFIGFYNDYSNLLGSDLAATGGTGSLDQFNAGEVTINGFELLLNYDFSKTDNNIKLPFSFGYTYTNTEFENSFGSDDDLWGTVTAGDELPYISKHQFNVGFSLEHNKFELNFNGRFNGKFRTQAGRGTIPANELVDSNFIIDFSGKYHFNKSLSLTGNIINLFDETYAASRVPAGLRPGHPFGAYAGLQYKF